MSKVAPIEKNIYQIGPTTGTIANSNGLKLHCRYWYPNEQGDIRGLVFLSHGFAEHLQWYEDLAHKLNDEGLLVFGHDHMGHGLSEGKGCHANCRDEYVKAVVDHCEKVKKQHPGKPCFIVGHSMGGMIAICSILSQPEMFSGAVLMGPLIKVDEEQATPFRIFLAKIMSKIFPYLPVAKLDLSLVTRDEETKVKLRNDPLRYHGGFRARLAMTCHDALEYIDSQMENIKTPYLIIHGEKDKLCSVEGAQEFIKRSASKDKKLKIFPGAYHNLYIELPKVRQEALQDTMEWIRDHLTSP